MQKIMMKKKQIEDFIDKNRSKARVDNVTGSKAKQELHIKSVTSIRLLLQRPVPSSFTQVIYCKNVKIGTIKTRIAKF